ncbi:MAG TPA: CHAP domain-containing protein [Ktedonobacterales bacterium]|nr:CHAP domain-containing protein [Ktedonobacterales bacterium]
MLTSDALWRNGGRLLSVALLGGLALNISGAPIDTMDAQGQPHNTSLSWLTLENGLLCRSWSAPLAASVEAASIPSIPSVVVNPAANAVPLSFSTQSQRTSVTNATRAASAQRQSQETQRPTKHCTAQWHIDTSGRLISDASTWAPNPTGEWPTLTDSVLTAAPLRASSPKLSLAGAPRQSATHTIASVMVLHTITVAPKPKPAQTTAPAATFYTSPGAIGQWTPVPGHPTYSMSDFAGDPHSAEFGVCTWWAWYARRDEPQLGYLGSATNWISGARAQGMSVGYAPAVGATVVFQPGVQGAGGGGHVGHVEQLLGGGWFIISEMNFYWNGGGWGRVDYRYAHAGSGVAFIY